MSLALRSQHFSAATRRPIFKSQPAARRLVAPVRASAVAEIVEKLKTLTLLEASQLVGEIERVFNVNASAAAAAPAAGGAGAAAGAAPEAAAAAAPVVEEKTAFDVILEEIPADKKVAVYKVVRSIAGIAVNQVKEYTSSLPKVLKEGVSKEEAETFKQQLADVGAKCKIA